MPSCIRIWTVIRKRCWRGARYRWDAKSLATHPASTTHQRLTAAQRQAMGVTDGIVRLSVGLEHPDDLVADVAAALKAA